MAGLFSPNHEVFRETSPAFRKNRQYRLPFLLENRQLKQRFSHFWRKAQSQLQCTAAQRILLLAHV